MSTLIAGTERNYMSIEARNRSAAAWGNDLYSDKEMERLVLAYRELTVTGKTQAAVQLEQQMADSTPFAEINLPENREITEKRLAIRPETNIDVALVDIPPAVGRGSSQKAWAEFASLVSDMDEEVIDQFTRDELISVLADRDIIDDPRN